MRALLITGTDTGVGKTWVGRALGHALARQGRRVVAVKPVEMGCAHLAPHEEDGALLATATGQAEPREALYRFDDDVAPAVSADAAGAPIDLDATLLRIESLAEGADVLLLEGSGGLLTPFTWEWTIVDVARSVGASALLVGLDRLGTINLALMTLSALELAGLEVAGMVLTTPEIPDASTGTNAASIGRLSGLDRIVALPRLADPLMAGDTMEAVIGWLG
jgi:dethiobiotin synthetase